MQDTDKPVNIDTSGPGAEVELDSVKEELIEETIVEEKTPGTDKSYENERETKLEDGGSADDTSEKPVEQSAVQEGDKQEDNSKQIEEYSEGVKKRIAKLTKRMREAERQKEEALRFAESIKQERDQFKTTADSLDKNYVAEMEGRITSSIAAAQEKLRAARQNDDSKAETEALASISQLGYEQGKFCLLYTSPSPRDGLLSRMPSSA